MHEEQDNYHVNKPFENASKDDKGGNDRENLQESSLCRI